MEVQRRRVLEATWRVLGRTGGLDAMRVEDVLVEAGVSRQTFYRCYESLDAVFAAVHAEIQRVLQEAVAGALAATTSPDDWLEAVLDAVFRAAVEAGPALAAVEREETRPGSPFEGARARRQALLADMILAWFRAQHDLDADPWRVRGVLMAVNQLCVAVCDSRRATPDDVARARAAAHAIAQGLLLVEGWRAGRWKVVPDRLDVTPPRRPREEEEGP